MSGHIFTSELKFAIFITVMGIFFMAAAFYIKFKLKQDKDFRFFFAGGYLLIIMGVTELLMIVIDFHVAVLFVVIFLISSGFVFLELSKKYLREKE